ncbi:MAG: response regulator transcription factor [Alphaproteobacteria bacterium]|nr:response regulator transcription factor [Alphaproteobacteria bacterium]
MMLPIDQQARQSVRILLVETDPLVREGLRASLSQEGFRSLVSLSSLDHVRDGFDNMDVDLLVMDVNARGGDACELVRKLRYSRTARNPFISVILTVLETNTGDVEKLLNSGADHIVVKPISPKALFDRIAALIARRRPFVATSTYIGPDRRSGSRNDEGTQEIPVFTVPNTLKLKAEKKNIDPEELQRVISAALDTIDGEMLDKLAFQIVFQERRTKELLAAGKGYFSAIADFRTALNNFRQYVDPARHAGVLDLAEKLDIKLLSIEKAPRSVTPRDLELTEKLSLAIYMAFKGDEGTDALASKISSALETFAKKEQSKKQGAGARSSA